MITSLSATFVLLVRSHRRFGFGECRGCVPQSIDAPDQDLAHQPAGGDDLRIGKLVADFAADPHGFDRSLASLATWATTNAGRPMSVTASLK